MTNMRYAVQEKLARAVSTEEALFFVSLSKTRKVLTVQTGTVVKGIGLYCLHFVCY